METHIYEVLSKQKDYSEKLKNCIDNTLKLLSENEATLQRPGMLLGKIQSGKTNAYLGIIAAAFDKDYSIAVILQKGTKVLSAQTLQRIRDDYQIFIKEDVVQVFDIMNVPNNLVQWELEQKIIIVAKKQTDNLKRAIKLFDKYPELGARKMLIIDDEADFASICFRKNSETEEVEQGKIAGQIDALRSKTSLSQYLQVTATPYSLYLQPNGANEPAGFYKPKKPIFTVLVPPYEGYIGGDYYFLESDNINSSAHFVFNEISTEERDTLKKEDRRSFKTEDVLASKKVKMLRSAIMNFIVGASIRRIQQHNLGEKLKKYGFIVHTEQSKASHNWQIEIIEKLRSELLKILDSNTELLDDLIREAYNNLIQSIRLSSNLVIPEFDVVRQSVYKSLRDGYLMITKVNSNIETSELLNEKGQLRLRTPLNIFVGGQILDRGITVDNLISFYYGRYPKKFQQDTVLQHSRMYGFRTQEDLGVTRFYTTFDIYQVMKRINEFDSELRRVIEKGSVEEQGIYFLRKDEDGKIAPCSPNKILLSNITTLKPFKRLLPIGFQTDYKSNSFSYVKKIDAIINDLKTSEEPILIDCSIAINVVHLIYKTLIFKKGYEWYFESFLGSLEYLSNINNSDSKKSQIWLLVRKDRNLKRIKEDGGFSDAPDTPKTEGVIAKEKAVDIPMLMLFRENGLEENGWRDSPFWWPVLYVPKNLKTVIFSSEGKE